MISQSMMHLRTRCRLFILVQPRFVSFSWVGDSRVLPTCVFFGIAYKTFRNSALDNIQATNAKDDEDKEKPPASSTSAANNIMNALRSKAEKKIPDSVAHKKLWRNYSHRYYEAVANVLRQSTTLETNIDVASTTKLEVDLGGLGANAGVMPSFSCMGALAGYTLKHFGRARLLGDLLVQSQPDWLRLAVSELLYGRQIKDDVKKITSISTDGGRGTSCRVASLGGGPGYDFLSLAALSEFRDGSKIDATVYEYEPLWGSIVNLMEGAVHRVCGHQRHCLDFEGCDITLPLGAEANIALAEQLVLPHKSSIDIIISSYCVAENALKLRELDFVFFANLFAEAKVGTLFFFTETTHRLWPELADVAAAAGLRVAFPHLSGSGKVGWQLVLWKDNDTGEKGIQYFDTANKHSNLYKRFQRDNEAHLARLDRGWKRDKKKIRGSK